MRSQSRAALGAAALAAALALGVAGCSAPESDDDGPTTLRIGMTPDQLVSFNLTTAAAYNLSINTAYETLYSSFLEFGGFKPFLSTGYELSDDWQTLTLHLQEGVTFSDGEAFTAAALKTYLEGMSTVDDWFFKPRWDATAPTLTAEDDLTLVIASDQPMPPYKEQFMEGLFTAVPIASPNVVGNLEATETGTFGSSPYILDSVTTEVGASYVRNDDYWNPDAKPFDTVELTVFTDDVAALNALSSGQVDVAKVPLASAEQAVSQGLNITPPEIGGRSMMLYIADQDGTVIPALADQRVRQAMALAFDREAINESLNHGYGTVKSQPWVDTQPEFVDDGDDHYAYDPERARELMAEAGYADGFDLVLPSTTASGISTWEPVVAQYLGDIGIRVTFDTLEIGDWYDAILNTTKYPVAIHYMGFYQILVLVIPPKENFNSFHVTNPTIDELWAQAQVPPLEASDEARSELGEYLVDESIVIPFATPDLLWASAPGITIENKVGNPRMPRDFRIAE